MPRVADDRAGPQPPTLLIGWSFLEGVGAALILPAIVALVASNFPPERRPAAYGLIAAAAAIAIAVGPLIGGLATTYFSWRWVFAGEVVLVLGILLLSRRIADAAVERRRSSTSSARCSRRSAWGCSSSASSARRVGLGPAEGRGPVVGRPVADVWLVIGGLFVIWLFFRWEARREAHGQEPLVRPAMLQNRQLTGGLTMFFFQYLVQAGFFFVVPLYLSVALGLSAIETGVRLVPLSVTLLIAAIGIPSCCREVSPRLVVRPASSRCSRGPPCCWPPSMRTPEPRSCSCRCCWSGSGWARSPRSSAPSPSRRCRRPEPGGRRRPEHDDQPRRLDRHGAGRLAPDRGADLAFLTNIQQNPAIPESVKEQAQVELAGGVPFVSDADLEEALDEAGAPRGPRRPRSTRTGTPGSTGLRAALAILAVLAIVALFLARSIPTRPAGVAERKE